NRRKIVLLHSITFSITEIRTIVALLPLELGSYLTNHKGDAVLLSIQLMAVSVVKQNRLKSGFSSGCGGGDGGEWNSARGFFNWPSCCFDWLLRLLACEFCPMLSSFVNLGGMVLPSVLPSFFLIQRTLLTIWLMGRFYSIIGWLR